MLVCIDLAWGSEAPGFLAEPEPSKSGFLGFGEEAVEDKHKKLKGVHQDLIDIIEVADKHARFVVFSGIRTKAEQVKMVEKGVSKCDPRKGHHCDHVRGEAIDVAFVHKDGKAAWGKSQADAMIFWLTGIAVGLGKKCIQNGSSWSKGLDISGNKFPDSFHLYRKKNCK